MSYQQSSGAENDTTHRVV